MRATNSPRFGTRNASRCCSVTPVYETTVDRVYDRLRDGKYDGGSLDVVIDSSGGDIDAAYNLSLLFRRYGSGSLTFFIPRWAKVRRHF